ncbi:hypothetical protein [Palleronia sp.]|uniref:hypothetical protein n=1 Tax=Palleronia sp. TaxID=1940284 RepID=UPI0035C7BE16
MARTIGIVVVIALVIALIAWFAFPNFGEDAELRDSTQEGVGEIVEEPGTAVE